MARAFFSHPLVFQKAAAEAAMAELPDGSVTTVKIADGAVTTPKLADGAVTSLKLAVSASVRQVVNQLVTVNFQMNTGTWTDIAALTLTTRGGLVALIATPGWRFVIPANVDRVCGVRWLRDPAQNVVIALQHQANGNSTTLVRVPLPILVAVDQPAAGTYTYRVQGLVGNTDSFLVTDNAWGAGVCWIVEFA